MSFSWFVDEWKDVCGIPTGAYEVAASSRSVETLLYYEVDAYPLHGSALLLSTHLVVTAGVGRKLLFWVALSAVKGMRCSGCVVLPGSSFDCPTEQNDLCDVVDDEESPAKVARRVVSLDIFTDAAAVTLKMMGAEGEQFSRSVLIVWRLLRGEVEAVSTPLHHPGDVLYALAGAPVHMYVTVLQCAGVAEDTRCDAGMVVDVAMLSVNEICIARKPQTAAVSWRSLKSAESKDLVVLPINSLSSLTFPSSTTLKLVSYCGGVWLFETPDSTKFVSVRHAMQRLSELFLVGKLASQSCQKLDHSHSLRHFELGALFQQFSAMDAEGVGHVLCSTLEAAMGPLLSCDTRLVRAMSCHSDRECGDDASGISSKISLDMYLKQMHIMLHGSTEARALIAFRAFGGTRRGGKDGGGVGEEEEYVTLSDFQSIARDILFGLRFKYENKEQTTDDVVNDILQACCSSSFENDSVRMTFPVFLNAYELLMARLEGDKKPRGNVTHVCGTPPPLLAFGSVQWVQFTYFMLGLDASLHAAADTSCCGEKQTYDLSHGTPTIAGVVSVPRIGDGDVASSFFRKRTLFLPADRIIFSEYASSTFATVRQRMGVDAYTLSDALGISTLRARLLLGCLRFPRNLRSSARSGAMLLCSHDQHFIVKLVTPAESRTLRKVLPAYVAHLERYPNTLLPCYSGLYALSRGGEKNAFVISTNVFASAELPVAVVYDLKGSTVHRTTAAEDRRQGAAGKDKDFLMDKRRLRLSAEARETLLAQLDADTQMLEQANMLDYSLLVGIHFSDSDFASSREATELSLRQQLLLSELDLTVDVERGNTSINAPGSSVFRAYYGGLASSDGLQVYYFGFVDCLTAYGLKKVGEHYGKSMLLRDMKEISCVPPPEYRARFMGFVRSIIEE